ncbi:MAG: SRPBCC family protein [Chitinophagaceae bacterium]|jgi:hypothetical protein
MKILKGLLLTIAGIVALMLIVALFTPKEYTVSVMETINKPKQDVVNYVSVLRNQEQYNEWVKADPNLHPEIVGTDGTVGAIQKWNSKEDNIGEGEQEITSLTGDRMDVDLRFKRPFEGNAKAAYIFKASTEKQTEITAEFYEKSRFPINLMSYFIGKKMIEKTQKKNLKNLKAILESR